LFSFPLLHCSHAFPLSLLFLRSIWISS
jgi:hypothetical protein